MAEISDLRSGVCRVCGCTESTPCDLSGIALVQFCWWVDAKKTLCSNPKCLAVIPLEQIEAEMDLEDE